jgi:hypothetical protein
MTKGGGIKIDKNLYQSVLKKLRTAGISTPFIKSYVLPQWWDEAMLATEAGIEHGLAYISSFFNIPMLRLIEEPDLRNQGSVAVSYKKRADSPEDSLGRATLLGLWAARLIAAACKTPYVELPKDASLVYSELSKGKKNGVGLSSLVSYAWDHGIPVLRLSPPSSGNHPDGLCTVVDGRPVIILMKKQNSCAWQEFILAHELGHAALGHVFSDAEETLIDRLSQDISRGTVEDEASRWACSALSGNSLTDMSAVWGKRPATGKDLSLMAFRETARSNIDPGFLILNYAKAVKDYRLGNAALMNLDDQNAFNILDKEFRSRIAEEDLSQEYWDRLGLLQG